MRPDAVATLRFFGRGAIAQSSLPCASVEIDASASLRARAQASQHTSTVLPPSLTFMAVASSLQSQAAQVLAVMVPSPCRAGGSAWDGRRHSGWRIAVRIFSDLQSSAQVDRALELRWRPAVGLAKGGAEVAVAGEAQIHAERGEVAVSAEQVQGARQPEAKVIAIERHGLDLLEHLRQIDRRDADLRADLGKRPPPRQIRRQDELGAVDQLAPARTGAGRMRCPFTQGAPHQGQGERFRLQSLRDVAAE